MTSERGVEIVLDDIGRPAIPRADARALLEERSEWAAKTAEESRRREEEAARESLPLHPGIPRPSTADAELSAYEVMRLADADAEEADPRRRISPREEFLLQRLGPPRSVETVEEER